MRRFTLVLSLFLLSLTLLAGSLPASAKPADGNNREAAKLCQKGGWATLATSEDPHTAFATEEACVSYAAKGGTLTDYTPQPLSRGCSLVASVSTGTFASQTILFEPFLAGERLTLSATDPVGGATGVQIVVNGVVVDEATGFPAELSYDIPADGTPIVVFTSVPGGGTHMNIGCFRP